MAENLLAELVPEGVDDYELLYLLERHYGSGGVGGPDQVVYPSSLNYAIRVRWKEGRAIHVERGPAGFSAKEFEELKSKIQTTLVDSPGEIIRTAVLFSFPRRVSGYFRTADLQILPASPEAPRPAETHAYHPFYLEFTFRRSVDSFLTNSRGARFAMEMGWLLNAILRTSVKCHGPRAKKLWVMCEHDGGQPWHSHWSQEGYWDPGLPADRDHFREANVPPIDLLTPA